MAIIADAAGLHRTRAGHDDMGALSRVADKDEELGKRDDEYSRLAKSNASRWLPVRPRRRRVLVACVFIAVVWMLLRFSPESETLKETSNRFFHPLADDVGGFSGGFLGDTDLDSTEDEAAVPVRSRASPSKTKHDAAHRGSKQDYGGKIRLKRLPQTLRKISQTGGYLQFNSNVLFAASSLKSITALIPMACEMRRVGRNHIHFAIFGRHDITLEELKDLHSLNEENCDVFWHDARPDNAPQSTETRAENGIKAAFRSIEQYMHPQAIITDDLERDDSFFARAIKHETQSHGHPIISIPKDGVDKLMWMAHLDVEPLREWHLPSVEILIHAPPNSVGTLRRLIRNLESADYTGLGYPKLTIEIPAMIDPLMGRFIEQLRWPPTQPSPMSHTKMLTIRHRIPSSRITADEASFRFIESFFPVDPYKEHVLVLAPNAQLSPLYYHYVKFAMLSYRVSDRLQRESHDLLGVALDVPSVALDGSSRLKLPTGADLPSDSELDVLPKLKVPFLWEAPSSGAALFFGDKWAEIHSFITNRIVPRENLNSREKIVSSIFPCWLEFTLELARARGYSMMYPALPRGATLATIHHESSHFPEEFDGKSRQNAGAHANFEPYTTPGQLPKRLPEDSNEQKLLPAGRPLHEVLMFDSEFPDVRDLPYLSYTGANMNRSEIAKAAETFALSFRQDYGGCQNDPFFKSGRERKVEQLYAKDLFCWGDETDNDYYPPTVKYEKEDITFEEPTTGSTDGVRLPTAMPETSSDEPKKEEIEHQDGKKDDPKGEKNDGAPKGEERIELPTVELKIERPVVRKKPPTEPVQPPHPEREDIK